MSDQDRPTPEQERARIEEEMRQRRSFARVARASVMWAYARSAVYAVAGIPAGIALARLLSPADFGIAAAATFFAHLAARLASGGLGAALVRMKDIHADHISTVFVVNILMAGVGAAGLVAAAPYVAAFYRIPEVGMVLPVVALSFVFGALSTVQQALLSRSLRYREMATMGSLDIVVGALTAVVLASIGFRFWSLVIGDVVGAFVKWIYGVYLVGWHLRPRFVPSAARELASFGLGMYTKSVLESLTRNADKVMIGRLLGIDALGYYDKSLSIVRRLYAKMTVVGPSVSFRIFAIIQDDRERLQRAYRKVIMTATFTTYLVFGALAVMAPHLVVVTFGEQWRPSIVPVQILCAVICLRILNDYANAALRALGWVWPQVWRQIVMTIFLLSGIYLAVPWGINGAAVAILASSMLGFVLTQTMMRRATGFGWSDILVPQLPAVASTAPLVAILWAVDFALPTTPSLLVLLAQAAAGGLFLLAFAWWCPFRELRTLMHETVDDFSPAVARFIWKDVARAPRARRRTA